MSVPEDMRRLQHLVRGICELTGFEVLSMVWAFVDGDSPGAGTDRLSLAVSVVPEAFMDDKGYEKLQTDQAFESIVGDLAVTSDGTISDDLVTRREQRMKEIRERSSEMIKGWEDDE